MINHVIAIGIAKYQSIPPLQFADKDAKEFYYLFVNNMANIGYSKLLVDNEASLAAIRNALGIELEEYVKVDDSLFIFFSGHGGEAPSQDGSSLANYLLPFDASVDIENTSISIEYLKNRLEKINCHNKIMIIDSCFSGPSNSKAYSVINYKSVKKGIKTFENTISGKGKVTFTASKSDELAIEDVELKNGLFTHYFLNELQNDKYGDEIAITTIHEPVTKNVMMRAEKHRVVQTPTFSGYLEGNFYLPMCKHKLVINPMVIEVGNEKEKPIVRVPVVDINVEDESIAKSLKDIVELVSRGASLDEGYNNIALDRYLVKAINELDSKYEEAFVAVGNDKSKIAEELAKFEAGSLYVQFMGCAIATFGSEAQMGRYIERVGELLQFGREKSGLVALINIPEIVLVDIVYCIGIIAIANNRIEILGTLLNTKLYDADSYRYTKFCNKYDIHYAKSLGGRATEVGDHVRKMLENNRWLPSLCPQIIGREIEYQLQVNLLLGMFNYRNELPLWADYGRFYENRVMPLAARIRDDEIFRSKIAKFLGMEENEVISFMKEYLGIAPTKFYSGYFWNSIRPEIFKE